MREGHHPAKTTSRFCLCALGLTLAAAGSAQAQPTPPPAPPPQASSFTLGAEQRASIERAIRADPRVQAAFRGGGQAVRVLVGDPEVDKGEAQAFLTGERAQMPTARVTALVMDPGGNVAQRIVVLPAENNRVAAVEQMPPAAVPFSEDDLAAAWALASRDPALQRTVGGDTGRFRPRSAAASSATAANPVPFAVEALPLRSTDPNDPCSRDRCMDLIFRTPDGYLPTRAHVNLTRQTATVQGRGGQR